jgi:hypothetical protein
VRFGFALMIELRRELRLLFCIYEACLEIAMNERFINEYEKQRMQWVEEIQS